MEHQEHVKEKTLVCSQHIKHMKKLNRIVILLSIFGGTAAMWMMDTIFHPELMYSLLFGIVYGCFSFWFLTKTANRKTPYEEKLEKMASESDSSCTLSDLLKGLRVNVAPDVHTFMHVKGWECMSYGKANNGDKCMFAVVTHEDKLPTVHLEEGIWDNNTALILSEKGYEPVSNPNSVLAFLPVTERSMDTEIML